MERRSQGQGHGSGPHGTPAMMGPPCVRPNAQAASSPHGDDVAAGVALADPAMHEWARHQLAQACKLDGNYIQM